jgi:Erv1 / Alr family
MNRTKKKHLHFLEEDYRSNDGMLTSIWGPSTWHLLHCISFNYPIEPTQEQKTKYMEFVKSLQNVLPCGKCRNNLAKNLKKLPLQMHHMSSRDTFSRYIYTLHETVNEMLCKHSGLSFEEVRDRYEHFRARCVATKKTSNTKTRKTKKENGCVKPYYGNKKQKCILRIVPDDKKCKSFR